MSAIADQVTKLEHDHSAALAKIDALNASNAVLTDALNALKTEKAALEAMVAELGTRTDGMTSLELREFGGRTLDTPSFVAFLS